MIGETSAFNSTISTDRTYSGGVADASARQDEQREVSQQSSTTDTVALSPEAIALAQNVAPTGESTETLETDSGTSQEPPPPTDQPAGTIDITV